MVEVNKQWVREDLKKFEKKFAIELTRLQDKIPHFAKEGFYIQDMEKEDITWWTNGFLGGILWQLADYSGNHQYVEQAKRLEEQLDGAMSVFDGLHHDVGFMWLHTAVAHNRRFANPRSKTRGLHAATLLAGRFNLKGGYLRSWNGDNQTWVIIDSLMNIPLLYWATQETKDERFALMAQQHAEKVLNNHLRKDGSVNHIVIFDDEGNSKETPGGQGYEPGSSWTRGQAWAIYGFVLNYTHTKDSRYLAAAKQVAHYFLANIDDSQIPPVDFRAPKEPVKYDTSAGLCAACGLLEISQHVPDYEKDLYMKAATEMVRAISNKATNWNEDTDGIIGYGTGAYHDECSLHVSLIYSDYFYLEALLRLNGTYQPMW
ncbi:unsaturated chondroitin disaccharide hydrolase [Enterococcus sp. AZ194]|uniref:glycoside hydrolase family 88 protein n=1 Tax=Enterococcus sp. AZ194 TaxID=2774629 RepID=UPI003F266903